MTPIDGALPPSLWALAIGAFLCGGISKGAIGLGLPVVVLAILAAPMGVPSALSVLILPAVLTNIWQALDGGALREILRRLWPFYIAAFIGVTIGGRMLAGAAETLLLGILGAVLTVYAALSLASPQLPPPGRHEIWMAPSAALAGGVMFGLVGNFIVPGILYLQALGLRRDVFVQSLGVTFIVISSALGFSLTQNAIMTAELALLSAACVPSAFLGMILGRRLRKLISEEGFRRVLLIVLLLVGVYTLLRAATA